MKNWLRNYRDRVGLSQEAVRAALQVRGCDVSRSSISHWEADIATPPLGDPRFRKALAEVLRVSVPDVLAAAGYEVADLAWSDDARQAAWIVEQLPEGDRAFALDLLHRLLDRVS